MKRLGTVCKWIDTVDQILVIGAKDSAKKYNTSTTTVAWLNRQTREVAEQKLWDLMKLNIESVRLLVDKIGSLEPELRMLRLSSEVFPCYTEPKWNYFWKRSDVREYASKHLAVAGDIARAKGVRLSMHPGQFCCIVSENENIVQNSLNELEYHGDIMRWMGYGKSLLDAKINVHLSGKKGISGFASAYTRMSSELRNMITLENDEFQSGLDIILALKDKVGIVLDLHHHWISSGQYIDSDDFRIKMIIESWCRDGVDRRPTIHYSLSKECLLSDHCKKTLPSMNVLLATGHKKAKLRAHSAGMWNLAANNWARQHWEWADVMIEAKLKNLAVNDLYKQWTIF